MGGEGVLDVLAADVEDVEAVHGIPAQCHPFHHSCPTTSAPGFPCPASGLAVDETWRWPEPSKRHRPAPRVHWPPPTQLAAPSRTPPHSHHNAQPRPTPPIQTTPTFRPLTRLQRLHGLLGRPPPSL